MHFVKFRKILFPIIFVVISLSVQSTEEVVPVPNNTMYSSVVPISEEVLDTPKVIEECGYRGEIHTVTSKAGYILELHRIPYGKGDHSAKRHPVILHHGLWQSSVHWVAGRSEKSLAFLLAEVGYDVWLANSRGNSYSNGHASVNNSDKNYWNFSFNEMADEDIPAIIDYILNATEQKSLFCIGFSFGNMVLFSSLSLHPEYNSKVKLVIALSPMVFLGSTTAPILSLSRASTTTLFYEIVQSAFGYSPVPDPKLAAFIKKYMPIFCKEGNCESDYFSSKFNTTTPARKFLNVDSNPTSSKNIIHLSQMTNSYSFRKYDYRDRNFKIYGQLSPPLYKIWKVSAPVALVWAQKDVVNNPIDVDKLARHLPNIVTNYQVPDENFLHRDFVHGNAAHERVYVQIFELLQKYT